MWRRCKRCCGRRGLQWPQEQGPGARQLLLQPAVGQDIQNAQVYFDTWQTLIAHNYLGPSGPGHNARSQSKHQSCANRQTRAASTDGLINRQIEVGSDCCTSLHGIKNFPQTFVEGPKKNHRLNWQGKPGQKPSQPAQSICRLSPPQGFAHGLLHVWVCCQYAAAFQHFCTP